VVADQVDKWLDMKVIEPSQSPFNSPVVLARKKDGTYRLCLDFRAVNQRTVMTPFPLPNVGTIFERLQGSKHFCKLDLASGFLQIPLSQESRKFTAFSTENGHYQFTRMPFGLTNSPLFFQKTMNEVLGHLLHKGVEIYMDDAVLHSDSEQGLIELLVNVLEAFMAKGLKLNMKKCVFGVNTLEFLGHSVSENGISVSESRKEALKGLPVPQTTKQLRQFLGSFNYVRDYIKDFSVVAGPLFKLLAGKNIPKQKPIEWTESALDAVKQLKASVDSVPLLHFVVPEAPLVLECDASQHGVGGVLYQVGSKGEKQIISFVSKSFSGPALRWSTSEAESFAVYYSITKLRHFLLGRPFTVLTDHKNLLFLKNTMIPKIERWALRLQEFSFIVKHINGKDNVVADSISRLNVLEQESEIPSLSAAEKEEILAQAHGGLVGHHGINRTMAFVKAAGKQWAGLSNDVEHFIQRCTTCAKMKRNRRTFVVSRGTTMSEKPFEMVSLDLMGPLTEDAGHCKYILVVVDNFSRYTLLKAIPDKSAQVVAMALVDLMGTLSVLPKVIRTDHGSEFISKLSEELFALLGVRHETTVTDHPSSNGMVERANQEVAKHLRCLAAEQSVASHWSKLLPFVQRIVNTTPNSTTGLCCSGNRIC
jgi:hypothetical protein